MSNNISSQLARAKQDYELALDNATNKQSKIATLQSELMSIASSSGKQTSSTKTDMERAHRKMDDRQKELLNIQTKLESIQKDLTKAQDQMRQASDAYTEIELKHRTSTDKNMREQDEKRRALESQIKREETERKSWASKAENARRDMEIWQRKMIDETSKSYTNVSNSKHSAHKNTASRQNRYIA